MITTACLRRAPSLIAALLIVSCGGGSSDEGSGTGGINGGGISGINGGGIWISLGEVSAFGSVIVNGVRYSTSNATITIGGAPATEAELAAGQILFVEGSVDVGGTNGSAQRVAFEPTVRGPIESIDAGGSALTVLGQPVHVSPSTVYQGIVPSSLESLAIGEQVQISGLFDSTGRVSATHVVRASGAPSYEVVGRLTAIDATAQRFRINALTVDYTQATLEGFTGAPANGDAVRVRGTSLASGVLVADSVARRSSGVAAEPDDNVDVEGLVTRFATSSDFDVGGQSVTTTASTQFAGGTSAHLRLDALLDVEGRVDAAGRLVAARIEILPVSNIEIEASLDGIDAAARTLRLLGIEIATDARTRYDDDDHAFGFEDLRVGDALEVAAYVRDGRVFAARIERDDDGTSEAEVLGPAADLASPDFRIAGIRITTDATTEFDTEDGTEITPAEFFATAAGRIVEVEGVWNGTAVLAEEVELED